MFQIIISPLAIMLSLGTGAGVVIHETKVDKVASLAMASPAVAAQKVAAQGSAILDNMPHTHSEGVSLGSASRELKTQNPSLTPRRDKDEKYRLQKKVPRGFHLFDSYFLPLDKLIR